jgi:HSP20 family protein
MCQTPARCDKDVKVDITGSDVTIEGERKTEREETKTGYYRSDCTYGAFRLTISLPEGAKASSAKATFENGVLENTRPVPKQSEKLGQRLEIQA